MLRKIKPFDGTQPEVPFDATNLGLTVNTIKGLPSAAVKLGRDIFTRPIASVGLSVARAIGGTENVPSEISSKDIIENPYAGKIVNSAFKKVWNEAFGEEPVKDMATDIANWELQLQDNSFLKQIGLDKASFDLGKIHPSFAGHKVTGPLVLSFGGVIADKFLSVTNFGGEKSVVKQLAKEMTEDGTLKILLKIGIPEELAIRFAPHFARTKDVAKTEEVWTTLKTYYGSRIINAKKTAMAIAKEKVPTNVAAKGTSGIPEDFRLLNAVSEDQLKLIGGWTGKLIDKKMLTKQYVDEIMKIFPDENPVLVDYIANRAAALTEDNSTAFVKKLRAKNLFEDYAAAGPQKMDLEYEVARLMKQAKHYEEIRDTERAAKFAAQASALAEKGGYVIDLKKIDAPTGSLVKAVPDERTGTGALEKIFPENKSINVAKVSPPSTNIKQKDPAKALSDAIAEGKKMVAKQAAIYTETRKQRVARAKGIGETVEGEFGFYAEKAALKGKMERVEMEAIRKFLGDTPEARQIIVDGLFKKIKYNPRLTYYETVQGGTALAKILKGQTPTLTELTALEKAIPVELVKDLMEKRTLFQRMTDTGFQLVNIPRALMASMDLSAPFRQGIFLVGRKEFWKGFPDMFKYFFSEKYFDKAQEVIAKNPYFRRADEMGMAFTEMGLYLTKREEDYVSQMAENIPLIGRGVRASGRAYVGFLNKLRMDMFTTLADNARRVGKNVYTDDAFAQSLATYINNATGRGNLGNLERSAVLLNSALFSPRLLASRLHLLNPVTYIKADPFVRKEMLKDMFAFTAMGLTVLGLAKTSGAEVGTNPNSADFGKIKIGDTRIDVWGGFQQYFRMFSQLVSGKYVSTTSGKIIELGEGYKALNRLDIIQRQLESKASPVLSFTMDWLRGKNYLGEKIDISDEIKERLIPMVLQDIGDIAASDPDLLPIGLLGLFGFGLQTYLPPKGTQIRGIRKIK